MMGLGVIYPKKKKSLRITWNEVHRKAQMS